MEKLDKIKPLLRFPAFIQDGGWKEYKLGDIAQFYKGKGISKNDVTENGTIPCIRYGELYTHYKEVIDEVTSYTDLSIDDLFMSKANDIIIPSSGETKEDIATASCVLRNNVALGGDINVIRTSNNGVFLSYYLNNAKKHDIAKIAQGISIIHLYNEQLRNLSIDIPNLEEQQEIAECLSSIDSYISSINEKVEQLKAHKKSLLQKLFPQEGNIIPKCRFPEFQENSAWEKREFKEVIKVNSGRDYKHLSSGNIPVYGTGGYMLSVDGKLSDQDAVGIGRKGTIDRPQYLKAPFWTVDTLFFLTNCDGYDIEFIYYLSQIIQWKKYGEQTGVPSLSKISIENLEVIVPTNIAEQKRIAETFSSLDKKIELLKKKSTLLEEHKKGLMQQLFPTNH